MPVRCGIFRIHWTNADAGGFLPEEGPVCGERDSVPGTGGILRQPAGVSVHLGSDGFFDSWSSNVSGDLFEKLRNFCEMTGKITEEQLTQAYVHGCGKEAPFSFEEERLWFTEGDEANFIFTEAASTAEVIARKPQKRKIMLKGQWV